MDEKTELRQAHSRHIVKKTLSALADVVHVDTSNSRDTIIKTIYVVEQESIDIYCGEAFLKALLNYLVIISVHDAGRYTVYEAVLVTDVLITNIWSYVFKGSNNKDWIITLCGRLQIMCMRLRNSPKIVLLQQRIKEMVDKDTFVFKPVPILKKANGEDDEMPFRESPFYIRSDTPAAEKQIELQRSNEAKEIVRENFLNTKSTSIIERFQDLPPIEEEKQPPKKYAVPTTPKKGLQSTMDLDSFFDKQSSDTDGGDVESVRRSRSTNRGRGRGRARSSVGKRELEKARR